MPDDTLGTVASVATEQTPLRIERSEDGISVIGEIDAQTAGLLHDALLPASSTGDLRVDVSAVSFIDSSGLRVLLETHRVLDAAGRRLVLVAPSRPMVRLFEVTGLATHLVVEPPISAAD